MEQTNTGTVAQMLEEGLAKMDAQAATSIPDPEVEKEVQYHMVQHGLTREQAMNRVTLELADAPQAAELAAALDYEQKADRIPVFPAAHGAPYAMAAAIHPLAVEVSTKMQGLTAEEVLAGLMPELSALYRQREELETKNERQAKVIEYYQGELNTISSQLATANQEVSFAFRAGQDLERAVGEQQADLVRLDTSNTVLAQKSNTYLADLRCIHNLMMNLLMRGRKFKDEEAAQEYVQGLAQRTALELTEEVVFASTDSGQFSTNFGSRVAATRQSLHSQAVAAESQMAVAQETTNEQDTGSEGLLQGQ